MCFVKKVLPVPAYPLQQKAIHLRRHQDIDLTEGLFLIFGKPD